MFRMHDNIPFCICIRTKSLLAVPYQELDWLPHIVWIISIIIAVIIIEKPLSMQLVNNSRYIKSHPISVFENLIVGGFWFCIESKVSPQCFQFNQFWFCIESKFHLNAFNLIHQSFWISPVFSCNDQPQLSRFPTRSWYFSTFPFCAFSLLYYLILLSQ